MPYADPQGTHNPAVGGIAPAAWGDAVRDALEYLARNKPHCRVTNSANISIANSTETALTFDSERYDVGGCHSTSTNTSRLTVPTGEAGKYFIFGHVAFAANATGNRAAIIRLNGTTHLARVRVPNGGADTVEITISTEHALVATDYVELAVFQSSGGALNVLTAANYGIEFGMRWVAL